MEDTDSPRSKKASVLISGNNVYHFSIIRTLFIPVGWTLTKFITCTFCDMRDLVQRKWQQMWHLYYGNALAHTVLSRQEFLANNLIPVLPQPPYSPVLSLQDLFLFPKVKMTLKRRKFQMVADIITHMTNEMTVIQQTSYEQLFKKWKR
jgi:hypothetical protein